MFNVSTDYKAQIKQQLRNPSYMKIDVVVTPPALFANTTLTTNEEEYYSDVDAIKGNGAVSTTYMTLERNRHFLDGVYPLPPKPSESPFAYQGFVGGEISGEDMVYVEQPYIHVSFGTEYYDLPDLTFTFCDHYGEYPTQVRVVAKEDSVIVHDETKTVTDIKYWLWGEVIPQCNEIEIYVIGSNTPFRRARIEEILFGIVKEFDDSLLDGANWKREVDLINLKLPTDNISFSFIDVNREYDPENPTSIYQYLEEEQLTKVSLGYELNDGTIEWINVGNRYITGEVKIKTQNVLPKVSMTAQSQLFLSNLLQDYTEGTYSSGGKTLYVLAQEVLDFCGIDPTKQVLDTGLQSYTTKAPIPIMPANQALQLIANAGMMVLRANGDDEIVIEPMETVDSGFTYELGDINTVPEVKKYPTLQGVDTKAFNYVPRTTLEEVASFDVVSASSEDFEFRYNMATGVTASVDGTLIINGTPEYYAGMCRINLSGTGTVTLNGYPIDKVSRQVSFEKNLTGNRCPIENDLVTNVTHASVFASWVADYVDRNNEYTFNNRGFPEIEDGDIVGLDTLFTTGVSTHVLSNEIDYKGTISGKTKLLIGGS